jgi:hypothetical protein
MATWIGAINDKWSEPLNWDTSAIPTSSEYVSFYGSLNTSVDVDIDIKIYYLKVEKKKEFLVLEDMRKKKNQK